METEQQRAIKRYIEAKDMNNTVASLDTFVNNPNIMKDQGIRMLGIQSALTVYKTVMRSYNVPPQDIDTNAKAIKQRITERNGKLEFIKQVKCAAASTNLFEPVPLEEGVLHPLEGTTQNNPSIDIF
jgi:hypothetical protein